MLRFRNIRVRSLLPDYMEVSWVVESVFEDVLDYDLRVQRSESPEGPFDYLTDSFTDKYLFIDSRVDTTTRKHRKWWYRVEQTKRSTSQVEYTEAATRGPRPDLIAMELRRQAMLRYKKISGRQCWLFPLRTFGQRCGTCYDRVTGECTSDRCPTCYNTTFARGYLDPVETWVQFEPTSTSVAIDIRRREDPQLVVAHMGYYPEPKTGDLLVEPENRRWVVKSAHPAERLRAPVRYDIQLVESALGSAEHDVPVKFDQLHQTDFANPFLFQPSRCLGEAVGW